MAPPSIYDNAPVLADDVLQQLLDEARSEMSSASYYGNECDDSKALKLGNGK